ncbi:hypothetical protein HID58_008027 [Brassica napus]|uniref:Uncharacterized protein n=1 Tax=Brassica napus TaxID=3708 RepID=A0ABQ7XHK0_BRANA|nr:hypothetical protein HID58_008027 [Brassica napus]
MRHWSCKEQPISFSNMLPFYSDSSNSLLFTRVPSSSSSPTTISTAAATIPESETPLTSRNSANPNPNPKRSSIPACGDGTFDRLMEEALEEIEAAYSAGDPHSQSLMGFVYGTVMIREKSKSKSFFRHNFAAEGGNMHCLFLNATSGSHFYFDDEVIASQTLFDDDSTSGTEYGGVQKLEAVSLAELNAYVLTSLHKIAVFVAFDTAITKLTYARATEVSNPIGYGEQDPAEYNLPYFLQDIVLKSYISSQAYRVNFSFLHELFTVARIFDPNQRNPGPSFALHGEGNNRGDNISGENCAFCKYPVGDSFSKDTHLPEANDQTIGPASVVQEASNTYQVESNSENVDDPQDHHKEGPQSLVFTMERNRGTNVSPMHIVKALTLCFSK